MADYASALWMPNSNFFPDTGKKSFVILHGTAGGSSAQEIAAYFQGTEGSNNPVSSHYIVGKDGTVVQTIAESNGAWGNGVVTNSNWTGNPNNYTISIEHVKSTSDNSEPLTPAQQNASFALIKDICQRNSIGMHDADDTTGVTGHFSIDPVNRSRCPGTFDWNALWAYLGGGQPVPTPQQPTAHQIQAANDSWDSVLKNMVPGPAPKGTGIYTDWLQSLINGKFYGPPMTHEYDSIDWNGGHIIVQEFCRARCEWNGVANWLQ